MNIVHHEDTCLAIQKVFHENHYCYFYVVALGGIRTGGRVNKK
jgi:hypothetical protein